MYLTDEGYLLRRTDSGESHYLLAVFLKENGLFRILARKRSRPGAGGQLPDLFDRGEFSLEQKNPSRPAFLKEFSPLQQHTALSRRYQALAAASLLARFYERNLVHLEHYPPVWELLGQALEGFSRTDLPELILFKALYVFARHEGYPVRAQWLESRPRGMREQMAAALKSSPDKAAPDPEVLRQWTVDLCRYFQQSTDLLPPESLS